MSDRDRFPSETFFSRQTLIGIAIVGGVVIGVIGISWLLAALGTISQDEAKVLALCLLLILILCLVVTS